MPSLLFRAATLIEVVVVLAVVAVASTLVASSLRVLPDTHERAAVTAAGEVAAAQRSHHSLYGAYTDDGQWLHLPSVGPQVDVAVSGDGQAFGAALWSSGEVCYLLRGGNPAAAVATAFGGDNPAVCTAAAALAIGADDADWELP